MEKALNIIYDKLILLLEEITDENSVNAYLDEITELEKKELFENLISSILDEINSLQDKKENEEILLEFEGLERFLEELTSVFPSFADNFEKESKLIVIICKRIFSLLTDEFDNRELDQELVKLKEISFNTEITNYLYINDDNLDEFIFVLAFDNLEELEKYFVETNISNLNVLFYLLGKIFDELDFSKRYCLFSLVDYEDKIRALITFVELKNVQSGNIVHKPKNYNNKPSVTSDVVYRIENEYNQFSETIMILSEYNKEKGFLEKFLKIYQVIENFMYRMPICELTNGTSSPNMFSIREFKRLYGSVDKNEINALKQLFKKVMELDFSSTIKFSKFISDKYNNFNVLSNKANLDVILPKIGLQNQTILNNANVTNFFASLIYNLRNSIVHNKETEFHLSYGNLPDVIPPLLEEFVLVCLEEIVYFMVINKNPLIWYDNQSINLYNV